MDPRTVLAEASLSGLELTLPAGQLDRPDYVAVNEVLTNLGGRWVRGRGVHLFRRDPAAALAAYVAGGPAPVSPRKGEGFVATPVAVAEDIVGWPYTDLARLPAGARVLEPSAGEGVLVEAILDANPGVVVHAVEPNADRAALIGDDIQVAVHASTLEEFAAAGPDLFDAVVMNPPFSVPGNATLWIDHVELAWTLLRPGGRLVAIAPGGYEHRTDRRHRAVRALVADHGRSERLPTGSFPTATVAITLAKPLPGDPAAAHHVPALLGEPVPVEAPRFTAAAVADCPVQIWHDVWRNTDRILRYRGSCVTCRWLVWAFDDGENDPRGVLGEWAPNCLDADEYDLVGPSVAQCFNCANTQETRLRAEAYARAVWTAAPAPAVPCIPIPRPSPERVARTGTAGFSGGGGCEQGTLFDLVLGAVS